MKTRFQQAGFLNLFLGVFAITKQTDIKDGRYRKKIYIPTLW